MRSSRVMEILLLGMVTHFLIGFHFRASRCPSAIWAGVISMARQMNDNTRAMGNRREKGMGASQGGVF